MTERWEADGYDALRVVVDELTHERDTLKAVNTRLYERIATLTVALDMRLKEAVEAELAIRHETVQEHTSTLQAEVARLKEEIARLQIPQA